MIHSVINSVQFECNSGKMTRFSWVLMVGRDTGMSLDIKLIVCGPPMIKCYINGVCE